MTIDFRSLANLSISNLTPYQPGKPIEELERELGITSSIKLASNENPLGISPKALQAAQLALENAHIYPDGNSFELKQALAQFHQISPQQLTIGNGSENVLELIIKAYLHANDTAIISQYAFLTIPILLKGYGIQIKTIPAKNFGHDVQQMIASVDDKTKILFLVNPNNPTGTYTSEDDFNLLMKEIPSHILVVVDEAYAEYMHKKDYPQTLNYLAQYPNLIITRTFSKAYGLAGLRLGYAISSPEIADILNRARLPFNVNSIAAKAGCAALTDVEHVEKTIQLNQESMQYLEAGLQRLHLNYISSVCNFITINVQNGVKIYDRLLLEGVIVRPLSAYGMPEYIRVTLGTIAQNQRFLSAIQKLGI